MGSIVCELMCEIPATKTPRILAAMKNLSTPRITHAWLLRFEPGGKVLTVCSCAKSLVWRGFWRSADVEKTEEGFGKKGTLFFAKQKQERPDASTPPQVFFSITEPS
jgi:hypothetical protein